jgi:hypothetical protein
MACMPDVLRLCSAFIPNADEITTCLREKDAELSDEDCGRGGNEAATRRERKHRSSRGHGKVEGSVRCLFTK